MPPHLLAGTRLGVLHSALARSLCTRCRGSGCTRHVAGYDGSTSYEEHMSTVHALRTPFLRYYVSSSVTNARPIMPNVNTHT